MQGNPFSSIMARPGKSEIATLITFDVSWEAYDGADVCELVGLFILNSLSKKFRSDNVGLYRDDGLVLLKVSSKRLADKARKELHNISCLKSSN